MQLIPWFIIVTNFSSPKQVAVFSPYRTTEKFSAELHQLLSVDVEDHYLLSTVESLAQEHGKCVYKEMLRLMVGKHFGAELSESNWQEANSH